MSKKILFKEQEFYARISEWDLPKGFMFGGLGGLYEDNFQAYAKQFMRCAKLIIDAIYKDQIEDFNVSNPVLYLYRHAVELYLKNILSNRNEKIKPEHSLQRLVDQVGDLPSEIKNIIMEIHSLDPRSTSYRYHGCRPEDFPNEFFCDARNLKEKMGLVHSYFKKNEND